MPLILSSQKKVGLKGEERGCTPQCKIRICYSVSEWRTKYEKVTFKKTLKILCKVFQLLVSSPYSILFNNHKICSCMISHNSDFHYFVLFNFSIIFKCYIL